MVDDMVDEGESGGLRSFPRKNLPLFFGENLDEVGGSLQKLGFFLLEIA
jgi:hypothetical protein